MSYFIRKDKFLNKKSKILVNKGMQPVIKVSEPTTEDTQPNTKEIITFKDIKNMGLDTQPIILKKGIAKNIDENQSHQTDTDNIIINDEIIDYSNKVNLFLGDEKKISFLSLINFKRFIKGKRIVLVANSSDLLKSKKGKFIDGHDIVIRFNSYKIDDIFTGKKTTIHASVYLQDVNLDVFVPIRFIISNKMENWYETVLGLSRFKQSFILKYNHHNDMSGLTKDLAPSTSGLVMLKLLKILGGYKEINLIGFNFYKDGEKSILRTEEGLKYVISKVHNYGYEKNFIISNAYEYNKKDNIITYYGDNAH